MINNVHRLSRVAFLHSIGCLLNDMYVFESVPSFHLLVANQSRMWMSEGGTLCAYAHYRASLLSLSVKQQ